ncbi:Uncharacterized protein DBV15_02097 [Temnothorax longispinosus]|uniref:Uncharacterized protein n=1 Tax=Temnothorax longispinosus TaxID=300112 RepID=A0A4V3SAS6_9HYME|nr:Uncharacterized protein DBV15_02097 [Temnothorax longispinosus]
MEVPCRPEGPDDRESILAEKPGPLPKAAINSLSRIFDLLPSPDPPPDPAVDGCFSISSGIALRAPEARVPKTKYETSDRPIDTQKLISARLA